MLNSNPHSLWFYGLNLIRSGFKFHFCHLNILPSLSYLSILNLNFFVSKMRIIISALVWTFVPPANPYVEILTYKVMVFGSGDFGRWLGHSLNICIFIPSNVSFRNLFSKNVSQKMWKFYYIIMFIMEIFIIEKN